MIQFSVIIPNYNHAPYLEERIESVLAQTYTHFEIIILDDCSTDNSKEIIEKYRQHPKVSHIVYAAENSGSPFKQWQKGLQLAKGDWVWFAESDDFSSPLFLASGNLLINKNPGAGIFYSDAFIDYNNEASSETFATEKNRYFNTKKWSASYIANGLTEIRECLGIRCTINNASSTLLRKDILNTCIGEIAGFRFHGDWYCYLAIAGKADIVYDASPLNTFRSVSSGIKSKLPEDGRHVVECFRILSFLCNQLQLHTNKKMVQQFVLLNLNTGLFSHRKEWQSYFQIDKKLTRKVFFIVLANRFWRRKKTTV
jgi:glycosyltransferase involved in cell wall biosynthesis